METLVMGYFLIILGLTLLVAFGLKLYNIMNDLIVKAEERTRAIDNEAGRIELNQASIIGQRVIDLDSEPTFAGMVVESSYDRKYGWVAHVVNAYGDRRDYELTRLVWEEKLMGYRYYRARA